MFLGFFVCGKPHVVVLTRLHDALAVALHVDDDGLLAARVYKVVRVEQEVEVLGRLRQEEGLHAVLQGVVPGNQQFPQTFYTIKCEKTFSLDVLDGGVAALCLGRVLDEFLKKIKTMKT